MSDRHKVDAKGNEYQFRKNNKGKFLHFRSENSEGRSTNNQNRNRRSPNNRRSGPRIPRYGGITTDYIYCPHCNQPLRENEFKDHLQIFHPEKVRRPEAPTEETNRRTLRRLGKAKPPRRENVPVGMAKCEQCGALVPKSRLDEHVEKKHSDKENGNHLDTCPVCDVEVRSDRLEKHLKKVHPEAA